jgi:hypothetical protein
LEENAKTIGPKKEKIAHREHRTLIVSVQKMSEVVATDKLQRCNDSALLLDFFEDKSPRQWGNVCGAS